MPSYCTECGEPLKPGEKFCTSCGAPVPVTPPSESPPAAPPQATLSPGTPAPPPAAPAATPPQGAPERTGPDQPPASKPARSIPIMYIAAVIGVLVIIGGAALVFGGFLGPDPAIGTWSYSNPPHSFWMNIGENGVGEIVIADSSDGFYLDSKCTWRSVGSNKYQVTNEILNPYFFTINEENDQLSPSGTASDAVLTRTGSGKPTAPSASGNRTGPRFIAGDVIADDPFENYLPSVVLAYDPSSDEYATDNIFHDEPGYYAIGELDYTFHLSRSYIDKYYVKLDHIALNSIKIK